jgi:hypothetical protein
LPVFIAEIFMWFSRAADCHFLRAAIAYAVFAFRSFLRCHAAEAAIESPSSLADTGQRFTRRAADRDFLSAFSPRL